MTNLQPAMHDYTRVGNLLAYMDRLIALENGDSFRCGREIGESIAEVRAELDIGLGVEFNRKGGWHVVQAAKEEGVAPKYVDTFIVRFDESVPDKITDLKAQGYRIFYVARGIGIVDGFIEGARK
ncbi:hypothetical protein [Sporosarcina psychrophila]|uniref:Biotin operon repressor n=1 Tax=Sporosarcina psychrophila TaxID=1476 RepID=A0ABV2KCZ0_SPOPS